MHVGFGSHTNGYGSFGFGPTRRDVKLAHRVEHLWLGTNAENAADKVKKGRQGRSKTYKNSKLTPSQVLEISAQLTSPSVGDLGRLAKQYAVSKSTICLISNKKIWKYLFSDDH